MARFTDPEAEARRIAATRVALKRDQRWLKGAFFGNISPSGRRRIGQNPTKSGHESTAFGFAVRYCNAVIRALTPNGRFASDNIERLIVAEQRSLSLSADDLAKWPLANTENNDR